MDDLWDVVIDLRAGGDWSLDLCFAGLNANKLNVLDVPYRDKHREWWDVIGGKRSPDWGLERRTLGFGCPDDRHDFIPNSTELIGLGLLLKRGEVRRVWLDERMESFQKYKELGLYDAKVPVVVVAGHDRFWNHSPKFVADLYGERLSAMLLDNWKSDYAALPFRTRRIGWSCNFDHYWKRPKQKPEKDIDICFVGYNSHPDRQRYIDAVIRRFPNLNNYIFLETEPDCFDNFIPKQRLFDNMLRSKICLNLRGAADGGKTLRAYEIIHVGSFMLSQKIDDPGALEDFKGGRDCMYFSDEEELHDIVEWALKNPIEREYIALHGHLRSKKDLSVKSRWESVLGWLGDGSVPGTL